MNPISNWVPDLSRKFKISLKSYNSRTEYFCTIVEEFVTPIYGLQTTLKNKTSLQDGKKIGINGQFLEKSSRHSCQAKDAKM
jgi:hypothetical protein